MLSGGLKNLGQAIGIENAEVEEGDLGEWKKGKDAQELAGLDKTGKYFGVHIVNPVTGRLNRYLYPRTLNPTSLNPEP